VASLRSLILCGGVVRGVPWGQGDELRGLGWRWVGAAEVAGSTYVEL